MSNVSSILASSKRSGDDSDEGQTSAARRRKRRSRWAPETEKVAVIPPVTVVGGNGTPAGIGVVVPQPPPVIAPGKTEEFHLYG